nr:hypothetical protein [Dyadobacter crusticola]
MKKVLLPLIFLIALQYTGQSAFAQDMKENTARSFTSHPGPTG